MRALVRRVERDEEAVVGRIAAAFAACIPALAPGAALPPAMVAREVAPVARRHLRLLLETVETGELPTDEAFGPLRAQSARAAAEGVALDDLLGAHHAAARLGWDALRRSAPASADRQQELLDAADRVLVYADAAASVVAAAYLEERLHLAAAEQAAEWALVDAFLAGRPTADAAARAGRRLAPAYGVLLLAGPVAREHLRSFEAAIAALGDGEALWRLNAAGANVLVPVPAGEAEGWLAGADDTLARLSEAGGGAPLVGTVAWGEGADGVARAGDDAVTVLRLVTGLGRPPGIYRLDDVLLEAALGGTAPGPAARLAAILAPLGDELLATLEAYLANDADRRASAAALHVHPNTLDYRLRRIAELTGRSPLTARGLQVLGAALTLRRVGRIRAVPDR